MFQLKWREFERIKKQKLSHFIMNQHGITLIMFTFCAMSLGYYFVMNQFKFYSWFLTIYAFQFLFGSIFEIFALYITFCSGWKRDKAMLRLTPSYSKDGSFDTFTLPKCVYYISYKDYMEWIEYKQLKITQQTLTYHHSDYGEDDEDQLDQPLISKEKQQNIKNTNQWLI